VVAIVPVVLVTIGIHGFSEAGFFAALRDARVDTFCDVRARRGVRGRDYVFANHRRLVAGLTEAGIRYLHFRDLAPSRALREWQQAADRSERRDKRSRERLNPVFIARYETECLAHLDAARFLERLGIEARVVALCCVERDPEACHRSLLAAWLGRVLGCEPRPLRPHLRPQEPAK
jgi:uncharacterized protein (DUF488 family)